MELQDSNMRMVRHALAWIQGLGCVVQVVALDLYR